MSDTHCGPAKCYRLPSSGMDIFNSGYDEFLTKIELLKENGGKGALKKLRCRRDFLFRQFPSHGLRWRKQLLSATRSFSKKIVIALITDNG
jgi:hypothetical protein